MVATRNRPHLLGGLVQALAPDPAVVEIVFVVDGEDDRASVRTLEHLAGMEGRVVPVALPRRGQLRALDAGVARARGEVVLLLDDDVLPGPGLATGHAHHHAEQPGLVVLGSMPVRLSGHGDDPPGTLLYAEEYRAHMAGIASGRLGVLEALWAGNVSMRAADCRRVGLFSERFVASYHSDTDLGLRLARAGLVGVYDPTLAADHLHRRGTAAFLRDARRQGAGAANLRHRYPERESSGTPERFTVDLPPIVGAAVRVVGCSAAAEPAARAVMAAGTAVGRLGRSRARGPELAAARLARRLMLCRGARAGEGA